jgi:Fur family ferric uptake transcriptional regulator
MKQARNTAARTGILEVLKSAGRALSHPEIQETLDGLCDRVTIYRVLDRLIEERLIHKVIHPEGGVRYAVCGACEHAAKHTHNHIHFSCEACNTVTCLETIQPVFKLPKKYTVNEISFTVSGLCPNCNK